MIRSATMSSRFRLILSFGASASGSSENLVYEPRVSWYRTTVIKSQVLFQRSWILGVGRRNRYQTASEIDVRHLGLERLPT